MAGTVRVWCALVGVSLAIAAGCGGSSSGTSGSSNAAAHGCALSSNDVKRISGVSDLMREDMAPQHLSCSTAFNAPGEMVVTVSEANGGASTLALVKAQHRVPGQKLDVQPVAGLGDEAFLLDGRLLAVRFGDSVVTLETGFTTGGSQVLTSPQLQALAKLMAPA